MRRLSLFGAFLKEAKLLIFIYLSSHIFVLFLIINFLNPKGEKVNALAALIIAVVYFLIMKLVSMFTIPSINKTYLIVSKAKELNAEESDRIQSIVQKCFYSLRRVSKKGYCPNLINYYKIESKTPEVIVISSKIVVISSKVFDLEDDKILGLIFSEVVHIYHRHIDIINLIKYGNIFTYLFSKTENRRIFQRSLIKIALESRSYTENEIKHLVKFKFRSYKEWIFLFGSSFVYLFKKSCKYRADKLAIKAGYKRELLNSLKYIKEFNLEQDTFYSKALEKITLNSKQGLDERIKKIEKINLEEFTFLKDLTVK